MRVGDARASALNATEITTVRYWANCVPIQEAHVNTPVAFFGMGMPPNWPREKRTLVEMMNEMEYSTLSASKIELKNPSAVWMSHGLPVLPARTHCVSTNVGMNALVVTNGSSAGAASDVS